MTIRLNSSLILLNLLYVNNCWIVSFKIKNLKLILSLEIDFIL